MKRLIVSIHDVGPRFEREVDHLVALLGAQLGGPRFAMLVVPDHWGEAPLAGNRAFQARLRAWSEAGVEMFVHGWYHKDSQAHRGAAGFKARHMTAGEGEFLGLTREEAARRMRAGRALIEECIAAPVAGFVAPAWLYSEGARAALADCGFALAEDHLRVWRPAAPERPLARGPVVTWASRSPARTLSSLAFAALARRGLHGLDTVRVAVHPGDVTKPALLASIERTVAAFARRRRIARYRDLIDDRNF